MTILINAISARQGGGQTYLNNLLSRVPKDIGSKIYILDNQLLSVKLQHPNIDVIKIPKLLVRNPFLRAAWELFLVPVLISKLGVTTYFAPGGLLSLGWKGRCKTVTMCRNMLPFDVDQRRKYRLSYMRFRNWLLSRQLRKSFERADHVIFISNFAKDRLTQELGFRVRNSSIIPHGVDSAFARKSERLVSVEALRTSEYFLYVSTIDVYKAQLEVVEAFDLFRQRTKSQMKLVLVGSAYPPYLKKLHDKIKTLNLESEVVILGKVPHEQLPALYQQAKANIFASECENCPNILLEALASGRPILCSSRPPMPEFAENEVTYFDPSKPQELADLLVQFLTREPPAPNPSVLSKYDWDKTAAKTWNLLKRLP